jgi:hypothetical protein
MRHTPSRICSACDTENIGFKNRCIKCNGVLDANNFKGQSKKAKIRENRKIIREQGKVKKRRKITPFEKELRGLAGERIHPRISKHAIIRFKQRLSITNQELVEKYGNPPRIKLTVPIFFSDVHHFTDENIGVENGINVFKIHTGTGTFVIAKDGDDWVIITFYHKRRIK